MTAYYNEIDPFAAAWLRELIADKLIAPGEVDERSIEDVRASDLRRFVQCHFFAGIGIWSLALRQAGWGDDEPIWTGSCPCQPFSAAGKGGGFADERHLWPAFHWLIGQCRPELVLGEQVASKDGLAWLDLVSADLEAAGYAFGAVDTCAAGFGAPHIRQRLYWMANPQSDGRLRRSNDRDEGWWQRAPRLEGEACHLADAARELDYGAGNAGPERWGEYANGGATGRLADALPAGRPEGRSFAGGGSVASSSSTERLAHHHHQGLERRSGEPERAEERAPGPRGLDDRLAYSNGRNSGAEGLQRSGEQRQQPQDGGAGGVADARSERRDGEPIHLLAGEQGHAVSEAPRRGADGSRPGPLNGLWRDADWLCCTDGKWRPVAPGTFPLAPSGSVRNRVGQLRGAGNAINLAQAQGFIEAVIYAREDLAIREELFAREAA